VMSLDGSRHAGAGGAAEADDRDDKDTPFVTVPSGGRPPTASLSTAAQPSSTGGATPTKGACVPVKDECDGRAMGVSKGPVTATTLTCLDLFLLPLFFVDRLSFPFPARPPPSACKRRP
jgi:hypothetical protein